MKKNPIQAKHNKPVHSFIPGILTASNVQSINELLHQKSIYCNTIPNSLEIQKLGDYDKTAAQHVRPYGNSLFQYCANIFENISSKEEKLSGSTGNAFFDFLYLAWIHHAEIVLSPDDIWQQIAMETATYIDKEAERLRKFNITHNGVRQVVITTDSSEPFNDWASPKYRWDAIINKMCSIIKADMKSDISLPFMEPFSTSGMIEKAASQICLLHCCKKYYEYIHDMCICGIEKVHYIGKEGDWKLLTQKIHFLKEFATKSHSALLLNYLDNLTPIINSIVEGYYKKLDLTFWNSIFIKNQIIEEQYGGGTGKVLDGWALKFLLYNKDGGTEINDISDVSARYCKASLKIAKEGTKLEKSIILLSGFSGIIKEGKCYRPIICVGVSDKIHEIENLLKDSKKIYK